jgi:hypothetical protein
MSSKYCSMCIQKLPISSFLKDTLASPSSRVYSTCIKCRGHKNASDKKRAALRSLDPNIQPAKRVRRSNGPQPTVTGLQPTCQAPLPPNLPVELPLPNPLTELQPLPNPPPELQPPQAPVTVLPPTEPTGFLPADEWRRIQDFNRAMEAVQLETCQRCHERGFSMDLKEGICHRCFLRDTNGQKRPVTPFLMSADNHMDPGIVPGHLPELTQVEEMVIARAHVQMLVKRVRGHQYHYTGHCVTFLQNIVRTVDVLPNLPSELDIVLLRPPESCTDDLRYRRQFQTDFRVRRGYILAWLRFLKANHPDYRYITISTDRIAALPVDGDVSSSVTCITDNTLGLDGPVELTNAPPNSQSVVLSLDQDTTEANLILEGITGRKPPSTGLPAPSIRHTPVDEASGRERILSLAFPTLYPTGQADLNTPRLRNVPLKDYARHLLCWHDQRFARHARWRFFVFNMYMRQKARSTAQFYV